jgi:hypothetical protein
MVYIKSRSELVDVVSYISKIAQFHSKENGKIPVVYLSLFTLAVTTSFTAK